jgi:hypothetical protein
MTADTLNTGVILMALVIAGIFIYLALTGRLPRRDGELERLRALEDKMRYLQDEDIRKGQLISDLRIELIAARERIKFLEGQATSKTPLMAVIDEQPLMVVIGDDPALLVDLAALRGVQGLEVTTLTEASYQKLKRLTDMNRLQGKPIRYMHFSIHAEPGGIKLDHLISAPELSEILDGVEIAVFMGCTTAEIADLLPIIANVVAFRDPVRHDEAWKFSFLFWRAIGEKSTVDVAFKRAKERSPTKIRECAELIQR